MKNQTREDHTDTDVSTTNPSGYIPTLSEGNSIQTTGQFNYGISKPGELS